MHRFLCQIFFQKKIISLNKWNLFNKFRMEEALEFCLYKYNSVNSGVSFPFKLPEYLKQIVTVILGNPDGWLHKHLWA